MKKAICMAFLLAVGSVLTSQAVVIHWAVDVPMSGTTSAVLVYVADGTAPQVTGFNTIANGETLDTVSGLAVTPAGIGEQATTDAATRSSGSYYIVLFNQELSSSYSWTPLAYDDASSITDDVLAPAQSLFDPPGGGFTNWANVPEPSSLMLLCVGAAVAALRRGKRV